MDQRLDDVHERQPRVQGVRQRHGIVQGLGGVGTKIEGDEEMLGGHGVILSCERVCHARHDTASAVPEGENATQRRWDVG